MVTFLFPYMGGIDWDRTTFFIGFWYWGPTTITLENGLRYYYFWNDNEYR